MPESVAASVHVAPTLDAALEAGSTVFCATLELAWKELAKAAGQSPLRLEGDPPIAVALENGNVGVDDLDPRSYVARAAIGQDGLQAIRAALEVTFGPDADPHLLPERLLGTELLAYAYLRKNLLFATPFALGSPLGMVFAGRERVRYFELGDHQEAPWAARAKQVTVHDHRSDTDFVVELATREPDDRLIIARVAPAATLGETVRQVLSRAERSPSLFRRLSGDTRVGPDEPLWIPLVDLDVQSKFESLANRKVLGTDWIVAEAMQTIAFRLDETGARVKSEAAILVPRGRSGPKRRFVCDGPFLVVLARRGREAPYFAAWIEDTGALCLSHPKAG